MQVQAQQEPSLIHCQFTICMMTEVMMEEDEVLWARKGKLVAISHQATKFRLPR